jgi:hypothetical protein
VSVKIRRKKRRVRVFVLGLLIALMIIFLVGKLLFSRKTEIVWNKYLVIGKQNVFVVYDEKLSLLMPEDIYISKDKTIKEYLENKSYSELYQKINSIFPEELEGYVVAAKKGQYELKAEYSVKIPTVQKEDKEYILTSALNEVFLKLYYGEEIKNQVIENVLVDILNANGRGGYAGKLGNKLTEEFSYKYNAANYEELTDYSYVIVNNISDNQLKELIMSIDEKYIRIKDKGTLPTLANVVLILGREENNLLNTYVYKKDSFDNENYQMLKDNGYKNVRRLKTEKEIDKSFIEYKKEDYFIAYKMSKLLNIENMLENDELDDRINIYIK